MDRDDNEFTQVTKELLARRAGYKCSFPGCSKTTVGPAEDATKYARIGVAAHIISASPEKGPRADPAVSSEYRKSLENGIWLCHVHADLIDSDESRFTAARLSRMKKDHEERIQLEMTGTYVGNGIVKSLKISELGRFQSLQEITFGPRNLILGGNGTGKTLLCDMVVGLADFGRYLKWKRVRPGRTQEIVVEVFAQGSLTWNLNFGETIMCKLNGSTVSSIVSGFRVFCLEGRAEHCSSNVSENLPRLLGVSRNELITCVRLLGVDPGIWVRRVELRDDEIWVKVFAESPLLPLDAFRPGNSSVLSWRFSGNSLSSVHALRQLS